MTPLVVPVVRPCNRILWPSAGIVRISTSFRPLAGRSREGAGTSFSSSSAFESATVPPGRGVGPVQRVPHRVRGKAVFVAHPANRGLGALEDHRAARMRRQDIAHRHNRAAVEPDLHDVTIAGQQLSELSSHDLIVPFLLVRARHAARLSRTEKTVSRGEVYPQAQSAAGAGDGELGHDVAVAVLPRGRAHRVGRGVDLPEAKPALVLRHDDDVARPEAFGGVGPLLGVGGEAKLLGGDGAVVVFALLPERLGDRPAPRRTNGPVSPARNSRRSMAL